MNRSYEFSVTLVDLAWAAVAAVLLAATFYYSGVGATRAEHEGGLRQSITELVEQQEACEKALTTHRRTPWALVPGSNGEYWVVDAE